MEKEDPKDYKDERFSIVLENGIIHFTVYKEIFDYAMVNEAINIRKDMFKNNSYPLLSDIRIIKTGSREARERLAAKDAGDGVKAVAGLISNEVHRIIFNFFNTIYKAPVECKLFTNREKALQWLEQFK